MVCTANDLEGWKDFPKGLRVLLLDEDTSSSSEIRSKLEAMDYIVTAFCNETEALSAFSSNPASFHVAIVEVSATDGNWGFHFLETTKDLPIIMTSNVDCLNTTMKCIALGAVEFLRKPLCEEKLKNIWQHVVHKAFNGGKAVSESVEPIKEAVAPLLRPKLENEPPKFKFIIETENVSRVVEHDHEQSTGSDKYPAPSTPQIKPGSRFLDDGDCQDQTNCLSEKESGEHDGESKSVETTCNNAEDTTQISEAQMPEKIVVKQEKDSVNVSKGPINLSQPNNDTGGTAENLSKASGLNHSYKSSRKKMKVDWTPELHKKFVRAVEQLGVDQAIPSRILELMKTEGLTRHNVASHLQKYRMHKRHILPKDDDRRLLHPRDTTQTSYYNPHHKPTMAFPPYHFNNAVPMPPAYPMWGKPASHPTSIPMWGPPSYPPWQTPENWHWNPSYPGMHADAWGCPVMPQPLQGGYSSYHQIAAGIYNTDIVDNSHSMSPDSSGLQPTASGINNMPHDSSQTHPAEEIIDKVVKEAMKKPWLPLPLGLKLPYPEGVLAELSRQGICNIPPQNTGTSLR